MILKYLKYLILYTYNCNKSKYISECVQHLNKRIEDIKVPLEKKS